MRTTVEFARFTGTFTGTWPLSPAKSPINQYIKLEARVGIAQGLLRFLNSPKPFGSGNFHKCCTDKEIIRVIGVNQANNFQLMPTKFYKTEHF